MTTIPDTLAGFKREPRAWALRSADLAAWAAARLINRTDAWGAYSSSGTYTAPAVDRRGREFLDHDRLQAHFRGRTIGAHCLSPANGARWVALDVDAHNDAADPVLNWSFTELLADAFVKLNIEPIIEDSNGAGGYHVWALFATPIPAELAYRLTTFIRRTTGLFVEAFPKQRRIELGGFGNWLRLPGRHHKRPHWSIFYDRSTETWCEPSEAPDFLLAAPVNDSQIVHDLSPRLPQIPKPSRSPLTILSRATAACGVLVNDLEPSAGLPVCVTDLLTRGIRRCGDRNRAEMTLARFCFSTGVVEADAVQRIAAFAASVPETLTTARMRSDQIDAHAKSVVHWVYEGQRDFACGYARSHGSGDDPIRCAGPSCPFVSRPVQTAVLPDREVRVVHV